jgi:hypothetical protein
MYGEINTLCRMQRSLRIDLIVISSLFFIFIRDYMIYCSILNCV